MIQFTFRFGTTEPLLIQLTQTDPATDTTTVFPLTGVTDLAVHLRNVKTGTIVVAAHGSGAEIYDGTNGIASLVPAVAAGLYAGWIVFTAGGKTQSFPNDGEDFTLEVLEAY